MLVTSAATLILLCPAGSLGLVRAPGRRRLSSQRASGPVTRASGPLHSALFQLFPTKRACALGGPQYFRGGPGLGSPRASRLQGSYLFSFLKLVARGREAGGSSSDTRYVSVCVRATPHLTGGETEASGAKRASKCMVPPGRGQRPCERVPDGAVFLQRQARLWAAHLAPPYGCLGEHSPGPGEVGHTLCARPPWRTGHECLTGLF